MQVNPHDDDVFYVTASTEGYYVNGVRNSFLSSPSFMTGHRVLVVAEK